ncbi:hypothetical protein ZX68_004206 [Salmonella enterica subsp. enterica]|nr:hypothetical protein [Salmonella enterica]EBE2902726.1 hypothetical protein [Salmonella enterica subsp. enterica serovar Krefeld]EDQ2562092.1 hypothetical protein [Salmonella enterica subsp. enterica serovar Langensalza]EDT5366688.1 hypothetical protein [Salmonella enterica subsp. enterica]EBT4025262.1 hypothetical protein [Salmonella enterica subsp. enterica serovar Krefeld]
MPEDGGKKSSASKGLRFYYGRWRTPDTSAVACPEAGVTLYCHSPQSGRRFLFPVNSGGYSCQQDYVSHWRWTACHRMRWSWSPFT